MNQPKNSAAPSIDRRSWLGAVIAFIGATITTTLGVTVGRFALMPAFSKSSEPTWIELGPLSTIPENELVRKNILISQEAGWGRFNAPRLLWVIRKGDDVTIFSGVCPHLGCSVNVKEETFICACHGSKWESTGEKTAGPAPRSLDTLTHKTENGILKVQYQDFKQGTSSKEVLT
jgi:menaquinol-cytochrome c reductase iron-sulfur subunit